MHNLNQSKAMKEQLKTTKAINCFIQDKRLINQN